MESVTKITESKVYTIPEIKEILGVSRTKAYEFVKKAYEKKEPFRVVRVGTTYRIIKSSFDEWLDGSQN